MKHIIKYITYISVLFWTTLATAGENVLIVGFDDTNINSALTSAGHTVTVSSTTPSDLTGYTQVWDMRYNNYVMTATEKSAYDTFLKNNGYIYFAGENSSFGTRNNDIGAFVSTLGGGTITVGGSAYNTQTANTTYFDNGETVDFIAAAAITTDGTGRTLAADGSGNITAMMWIGNADDLGTDYNGTVVVVADINWTQGSYYDANNQEFLEALIAGIAASTTSGTISATGNTAAAPTPVYRSAITSVEQAQVDTAFGETTGNNIDLTITGNSNDVDITQLSNGNYLLMYLEGNSNVTDITQSGTNADRNFADINIVGSSNNLTFIQQGDSEKQAFLDIDGDFGTYNINQKDSGAHYLNLKNTGDSATVTVLQEGAGNHSATVELTNSGGVWNFNLTQSGDTNQLYSLPHDLSDNTVVSGTCTSGTCNLTVNQQ